MSACFYTPHKLPSFLIRSFLSRFENLKRNKPDFYSSCYWIETSSIRCSSSSRWTDRSSLEFCFRKYYILTTLTTVTIIASRTTWSRFQNLVNNLRVKFFSSVRPLCGICLRYTKIYKKWHHTPDRKLKNLCAKT